MAAQNPAHFASRRLADLQRAMRLIADAVERLPHDCRDLAGNALLNMAAETVAQNVGCAEAGRIFARLGDLLGQGHQPPMTGAIPLTGFDT
jgi:predicted Zn-dependent protease with MMP-like domain